jgi:hypothetical protein
MADSAPAPDIAEDIPAVAESQAAAPDTKASDAAENVTTQEESAAKESTEGSVKQEPADEETEKCDVAAPAAPAAPAASSWGSRWSLLSTYVTENAAPALKVAQSTLSETVEAVQQVKLDDVKKALEVDNLKKKAGEIQKSATETLGEYQKSAGETLGEYQKSAGDKIGEYKKSAGETLGGYQKSAGDKLAEVQKRYVVSHCTRYKLTRTSGSSQGVGDHGALPAANR